MDIDTHTTSHVPENYDEYYLRIVRAFLRYACPISAVLFLGFALLDWQFIPSFQGRLKALLMRSCASACTLGFWLLAKNTRSLNLIVACETTLYLVYLLAVIGVLMVMGPSGLIFGASALVLITMCATGVFISRPIPATVAGLVGVAAFIGASLSVGLPNEQIVPQAVNWAVGVLISGLFLFLLDREFRQKHALELSLEKEKRQSETLLKQLLPGYVIQRILEGADNIAESVSEVNVIFIDIVGFTALSRRLAPKHLVEVLAEVFRMLDNNCEKYGVTKIKTIGDAYMAATGAPEPADLSAIAAVQFCLDGISGVNSIGSRIGIPLSVRLGIATGAVISGVLSLKRPAYDLWGETVNLASRMESTGEAGAIHIAETTYWRVKDMFVCEYRGVIDAKGMGSIQTYFIRSQ